jgi:putative copper resistance protein D
MLPDALITLIAVLDLAAFVTAVGGLACLLWMVPWNTIREPALIELAWHRLRHLLAIALAILTATSALLLVVRAVQMSGLGLTALWPVLPTVVLHTHYGTVWLVRVAALGMLWIGWLLTGAARKRRTVGVMGVAAAVLAWTYSATGHAADQGDFTVMEWIHWLHMLTVSLWGGCVLAVAVALAGLLVPRSPGQRAFIAVTMHRFSYIAILAVIGISASGVFVAIQQLSNVHDLWTTDYGRMLLTKLAMVFAMLVLGVFNRFALSPALRTWLGAGRLPRAPEAPGHASRPGKRGVGKTMVWHRRLMITQAVLVVAVLLCAILLAASMPPSQHTLMKHPPAGAAHTMP